MQAIRWGKYNVHIQCIAVHVPSDLFWFLQWLSFSLLELYLQSGGWGWIWKCQCTRIIIIAAICHSHVYMQHTFTSIAYCYMHLHAVSVECSLVNVVLLGSWSQLWLQRLNHLVLPEEIKIPNLCMYIHMYMYTGYKLRVLRRFVASILI